MHSIHRNTAVFVIIAAASVLSCQKESFIMHDNDTDCLIRLSPLSADLTKAPVFGSVFPSERKMVVSAFHNPESGIGQNYFSGETFIGSGSTWEGNRYWPISGTLNFLVYSADGLNVGKTYESNVCSGVTLTVPDNSTAQTDILWGYVENKSEDDDVNIPFRHAEATLVFTAKATSGYDAVSNKGVTINSIIINNCKCSGTVKLSSGMTCSWSSLGTQKNISLPGLDQRYEVPAAAIDISTAPSGIGSEGVVVIPQKGTSFTVNYIVHSGRNNSGNAIDEARQYTYTCGETWTAGNKYVYKLDFNLAALSVTASIYDWALDSRGIPVMQPVSATYSVSGGTSVTLPPGTMAANSIVGIDWGDGVSEVIDNSTKSSFSGSTVTLNHTYPSEFTGTVRINVLRGTLNFGEVLTREFVKFAVSGDGKVTVNEKQFLFTVNSSGKKVVFAPGNLYWDGSSFKFEEHQYDFPSTWNANHVGHFYYSKDAAVARAQGYSDSPTVYDNFFACNGGAIPGWDMLSQPEWSYVVSRSSGKYDSSINGKKCYILKPDGFAGTINSSYTVETWAVAEEEHGLVALPWAGERSSGSIGGIGSRAYYWTGSPRDDMSDHALYMYCEYWSGSNHAGTAVNGYRTEGMPVRLVKVR